MDAESQWCHLCDVACRHYMIFLSYLVLGACMCYVVIVSLVWGGQPALFPTDMSAVTRPILNRKCQVLEVPGPPLLHTQNLEETLEEEVCHMQCDVMITNKSLGI